MKYVTGILQWFELFLSFSSSSLFFLFYCTSLFFVYTLSHCLSLCDHLFYSFIIWTVLSKINGLI